MMIRSPLRRAELSNPELTAYKSNPETFSDRVQKPGGTVDEPIDLFSDE